MLFALKLRIEVGPPSWNRSEKRVFGCRSPSPHSRPVLAARDNDYIIKRGRVSASLLAYIPIDSPPHCPKAFLRVAPLLQFCKSGRLHQVSNRPTHGITFRRFLSWQPYGHLECHMLGCAKERILQICPQLLVCLSKPSV